MPDLLLNQRHDMPMEKVEKPCLEVFREEKVD